MYIFITAGNFFLFQNKLYIYNKLIGKKKNVKHPNKYFTGHIERIISKIFKYYGDTETISRNTGHSHILRGE